MVINTNQNILSNNLMHWDLSLIRDKDTPLSKEIKRLGDTDLLIVLSGLTYEFCIDFQEYIRELEELLFEGDREAREKFDLQE